MTEIQSFMEDHSLHVNPQVKRVIRSFQTAAVSSLSGPTPNGLSFRTLCHHSQSKMLAAEAGEYHKDLIATKKRSEIKIVEYDKLFHPPRAFPAQRMPVFTPVDITTSERAETVLEGEIIACFNVGGEKRLCLPQILNTVLRHFTLQQINSVCDEMHIFCSRCYHTQLEALKALHILPPNAPSCGLITRTDAERLCSALLRANPDRSMEPASRNSFKVYHECFGKCKGIFISEAYTRPESKCIRCVDCFGMFSPPTFVCHCHKSVENHTCHWGFDSANWRSYLLLSKDQNLDGKFKLQDAIEEVKSRFDPSRNQKRRQSPERSSKTGSNSSKRLKSTSSSDTSPEVMVSVPAQVPSWEALSLRQLSVFYPWSPYLLSAIKEGKLLPPPAIMRDELAGILPSYLHTGPPVLLNPERVVPYSESERYERHFTPNVSLAPSCSQRTSPDDGDQQMPSKTCISGLHSLGVSLPGNSKFCRVHKDTVEYDVLTDTDESSLASPTDSCRDIRASDVPVYKSTLQQEMDMIRSLLSDKVEPTSESQTHFLQEYSKLRAKTEETVQWLLRVHRVLKQELETSRKHGMELDKLRSKAERELKCLALQREYALTEARVQKEQTQAKCYNKRDLEFERRRRSIESLYQKVCKENLTLQRELAVMMDNSTSEKYVQDHHRSFKSRLKMVLDLTVPKEAVVASKRTQLGY